MIFSKLAFFRKIWCGGVTLKPQKLGTKIDAVEKDCLVTTVLLNLFNACKMIQTAKSLWRYFLEYYKPYMDIALLKLPESVPCSDTIRPVCLPQNGMTFEDEVRALKWNYMCLVAEFNSLFSNSLLGKNSQSIKIMLYMCRIIHASTVKYKLRFQKFDGFRYWQ